MQRKRADAAAKGKEKRNTNTSERLQTATVYRLSLSNPVFPEYKCFGFMSSTLRSDSPLLAFFWNCLCAFLLSFSACTFCAMFLKGDGSETRGILWSRD